MEWTAERYCELLREVHLEQERLLAAAKKPSDKAAIRALVKKRGSQFEGYGQSGLTKALGRARSVKYNERLQEILANWRLEIAAEQDADRRGELEKELADISGRDLADWIAQMVS